MELRKHLNYFCAQTLLQCLFVLFLSRNSLTGTIGYEFFFFLGIFSYFLHIFLGSFYLQKLRKETEINLANLANIFLISFASLFVASSFGFLLSLRYPLCDIPRALLWFFLFPNFSILFGISSLCFSLPFTRKWPKTIFISLLPFLIVSLVTLYDLLLGPKLSFYHPALGFFHGPLYDELILIPHSFYLHRIWVFVLSFLLLTPYFYKKNKLKIYITLIVLLSFGILCRNQLGWSTSYHSVKKELAQTVKNKHISIFYSQKTYTPKQAQRLLQLLHYYYEKNSSYLYPSTDERPSIEIYIYPNAQIKKQLTGTRYTLIGNPLQKRVHILPFNPHNSIFRHEVTHVIAHHFGFLGFSTKPALLEGLATAVEHYRNHLSVHEWAKAIQTLDKLPSLEVLFSGGQFWRYSASKAYLSAGSFVRWLIDTYGMDKFRNVYLWGHFSKVYTKNLRQLEKEWLDFLSTIQTNEFILHTARPFIKQKSIFSRQCPHASAFELDQVRKCNQDKRFLQSLVHSQKALAYSNEHPSVQIRVLQSLTKHKQWEKIRKKSIEILQKDKLSNKNRFMVQLLYADALIHLHQMEKAEQEYQNLLSFSYVSVYQKIKLYTRLDLINHTNDLVHVLNLPAEKLKNIDARILKKSPALCIGLARRSKPLKSATLLAYIPHTFDYYSDRDIQFEYFRLQASIHEQNKERSFRYYKKLEKLKLSVGNKLFVNDQILRIQSGK